MNDNDLISIQLDLIGNYICIDNTVQFPWLNQNPK